MALRPATSADIPAMLELMDLATVWLAQQGNAGQWGDGTTPHATNPNRIKQATEKVETGGTWVAVGPVPPPNSTDTSSPQEQLAPQGEDQVIGALTVHTANAYVAPATEPERYVSLLLTHRAWKGHGLGTLLVDKARELARAAGVGLLRVDCYAGGNGKLVRWYESQGFVKTESFMAEGTWPGQLLEMRL